MERVIHMKYVKWLWELVNDLAWGITQNGRVEILPDVDDDCNDGDG